MRYPRTLSAFVAGTLFITLLAHTLAQQPRPARIAVFGSSVAFGTGDEFNKEGYTGFLRDLLKPRGWEVLNQSRPGDNTKTMAPRFAPDGAPQANVRYLLPVNPGYVLIGLSLANEGILEATGTAAKDSVFKQYADGIGGFIDKARENNITPIVGLVYPRMSYTAVEYAYVRRMNLLQNSWDVPSVNFLGALDDGAGRYAQGFDFDDRHPNSAGHRELMYAIVPTLFDALAKGKPAPRKPVDTAGFARAMHSATSSQPSFLFTPADTIHSFAVTFSARVDEDGTLAAVVGSNLDATMEVKNDRFSSMTLARGRSFGHTIRVQNGVWTFTPSDGPAIVSKIAADGKWHDVVLSHYAARGETLFFVDGKLVGTRAERLQPTLFVLGGSATGLPSITGPRQADYKDLMVYRAALNPDEVEALHQGKLLPASLEVYAPLDDAQFPANGRVANRAQSMSVVSVGSESVAHVPGIRK